MSLAQLKRLAAGLGVALGWALFSFSALHAQHPAWIHLDEIDGPQYFAVWVEDVDRSVEWYSEVFGVEKAGGSRAEDGAWRIENLRNARLFIEIIRDNRAEAVDFARGFGKVGFFVPDIEAVADRVAAATGERPRVLDFEEFGVRILQLRDPDGNIIQLFSGIAPD